MWRATFRHFIGSLKKRNHLILFFFVLVREKKGRKYKCSSPHNLRSTLMQPPSEEGREGSLFRMFCWGGATAAEDAAPAGAGGESFALPERELLLSPATKSNQKRHETTFQDFLCAGRVSANLTVLISRNGHGGCRCRFRGLLVPLAPLPLMRCGGRGWCVGRMGDYQISQSRPEGGFGRWRLTPPGMGGTACGWNTSSAPAGGTFSCAHPQCVPQGHLLRGAHWGCPQGGRFGGYSAST